MTDAPLPIPPGYQDLKPVELDMLAGRNRPTEHTARFAAELNAIYITALELFQAARHYPIGFARVSGKEQFIPMAVTSLQDRRNLFVDADGNWRADCYVPAWVRRWPFFTASLADDPDRALICVDPGALVKSDTPLVNAAGEKTEAWQRLEKLIQDFETARKQTADFTQAVAKLDILEPFQAHALGKDGSKYDLGGLFRVNEDKLNALPEKTIKQLMKSGRLSRIYAHLMSLENFQKLLDMTATRKQQEK